MIEVARKLFLFAVFLIAATSEMYAAVRPAESTPEKGSWPSYWPFNSREKKSRIAPNPSANMEKSKWSDSIKSGSSVSPEPVKKTRSQVSPDSNISEESDNEKRMRTQETIRYFQGIADEILYIREDGKLFTRVPEVKKSASLPWLRAGLEEKNMREQYYKCSKIWTTNRLMRCAKECIENAHELFSSQDRKDELQELCVKRCTRVEKQFIAKTAEQIESYNNKQPRRY